jgi:hypothetical protein
MRFARSKIDLAMFLMAPIVARKSYADYTSGQRRLWVNAAAPVKSDGTVCPLLIDRDHHPFAAPRNDAMGHKQS